MDVVVPSEVVGGRSLDVTAERSADGKTLVLQRRQFGGGRRGRVDRVAGIQRQRGAVVELAAPLDGANTAGRPSGVVPREWEMPLGGKAFTGYTFPPRSISVLRLE